MNSASNHPEALSLFTANISAVGKYANSANNKRMSIAQRPVQPTVNDVIDDAAHGADHPGTQHFYQLIRTFCEHYNNDDDDEAIQMVLNNLKGRLLIHVGNHYYLMDPLQIQLKIKTLLQGAAKVMARRKQAVQPTLKDVIDDPEHCSRHPGTQYYYQLIRTYCNDDNNSGVQKVLDGVNARFLVYDKSDDLYFVKDPYLVRKNIKTLLVAAKVMGADADARSVIEGEESKEQAARKKPAAVTVMGNKVNEEKKKQARKKQATGAAKVMNNKQRSDEDEGNEGARKKPPAKVVTNKKRSVADETIEEARKKPATDTTTAKVIMSHNKKRAAEDDGKKPAQKKPAKDTTATAKVIMSSNKKRAAADDDGKKQARKKPAKDTTATAKAMSSNKKRAAAEDDGKNQAGKKKAEDAVKVVNNKKKQPAKDTGKKQARTKAAKGATKVVDSKKRPVEEKGKKKSKRGKISFTTKPQDVLGYDPDRNNPGNILFRELVAAHSLDFNTDEPDLSVQSIITAIEVQGGRFLSANNQMVLADSEVTAKVWVALYNSSEQNGAIQEKRRDIIGKSSPEDDTVEDDGLRTTDVVGGTGWCPVTNPGNLVFLDAVARYAEDYGDPTKVATVINSVLQAVHHQDPPGRFLSNNNQSVLTKAQTRKKVAGALKAKLNTIQRKGRDEQPTPQGGEIQQQSSTASDGEDRLSNLLVASAKRTAMKMGGQEFVSTQDLFEPGKASLTEGVCQNAGESHGASLTSSLPEGGEVMDSSCRVDDDAEEELCALQNILEEAVQVDVFAHDSLRRGAMRRVFNPKKAR